MRWLLLDEVVDVQKSVKAITRSRVPQTEASSEFLMIEMMAQTGGLLLGAENDFADDLVFAKIEEARFYPGFTAGEKLEIEAVSENLRPEGSWIDGSIKSARGKVAEARFLLMNAGRLVPDIQGSVTFHQAFMNHFKVREKVR